MVKVEFLVNFIKCHTKTAAAPACKIPPHLLTVGRKVKDLGGLFCASSGEGLALH